MCLKPATFQHRNYEYSDPSDLLVKQSHHPNVSEVIKIEFLFISNSGLDGDIEVELFEVEKGQECDVVFLAVSGDFALEHAPELAKKCVVIDNSSAFRYDKDIPLCIPEINGDATKGAKLVANPNCTTAIGLMALWPLHKLFGLKKVLMSVCIYCLY